LLLGNTSVSFGTVEKKEIPRKRCGEVYPPRGGGVDEAAMGRGKDGGRRCEKQ
jgi:hypothetical protein